MKLKVPAFLTRRPAFLKTRPAKPRPQKTLRANAASRRMSPTMDDDLDDEPTTRLSSAFFVVLILHLVAVGGIWAFNSIKAHRRAVDTPETKSAAAQSGPEIKSPSASAPMSPELDDAKALHAPVAGARTAGSFYQVKTNDTLTKIAATLGVSVADLQAANDPKEIEVLHPGQVLNVPARKVAAAPPTTMMLTKGDSASAPKKTASTPAKKSADRSHKVQKGDTLTYLAKRYGSTVEELVKFNKIKDPKRLQLGQVLKIPAQ